MAANEKTTESDKAKQKPLSNATEPSASDTDKEFRRIIQYGNKIQIFRALLQEFCRDCSIQGFKYFSERKRHWSERMFWIIMFVIAVCLSGVMIYDSYIKWQQTPVIISLSTKATPVWKVPFPAVTICPEVKTSSAKINLTEIFQKYNHNLNLRSGRSAPKMSNETLEQIEALMQICDPKIRRHLHFDAYKNTTDASFIETLYDLTIKLEDTLNECEWRNHEINCKNLFRPILTEEGVCFTFNSLNSRDIYTDEVAPELLSVTGQPEAEFWNLEHGYDDIKNAGNELALDTYPNRVLGTGYPNGLSVGTNLRPDDLDFTCRRAEQGYKVLVHSPIEIPEPSKNCFKLAHDEEILVAVLPTMLETSEELQNYPPSRKLCYLNKDKKLRFFKIYTQQNCQMECISNHTRDECGCVFFSYPRDKNTSICGVAKHDCVASVEKKMVKESFLDSLKGIDSPTKRCNCLPACTTINYDIEQSPAKFDMDQFHRAVDPTYNNSVFSLTARLKIHFRQNEFLTSKRIELFGVSYFLASCGGLLGLFVGVTALSFVEIFYYLTLRLMWTLRMYRYGKKSQNNPANEMD